MFVIHSTALKLMLTSGENFGLEQNYELIATTPLLNHHFDAKTSPPLWFSKSTKLQIRIVTRLIGYFACY